MSKLRNASLVATLFALLAMIGGCATLASTDQDGNVSASPDIERETRPSEIQTP